MRTRVLAICLVTAALLLAAAARAGTLASATWLQVTQGVPMTRTSGQLAASGSSTATSIAVSLSYPAFSVTFFVPKGGTVAFQAHFKITQGGPQAITATPGMAHANIAIPGTVIVMTADHAAMGVNQSMTFVGVNTLVNIPLRIGVASQYTMTFVVVGQTDTLRVTHFAWTPGMQTFTGLTSKGVALPSVMAAGSFNLNGAGAGTVTLVSPSKISIDGAFLQRRTASFTTLKLTFVPEPATVLLLGAAAAALVLARRR